MATDESSPRVSEGRNALPPIGAFLALEQIDDAAVCVATMLLH